jgi:hypothetical protein
MGGSGRLSGVNKGTKVQGSARLLWCASIVLLAPAAAFASCDSVKASVDANIKAKKLQGYSLTVQDASAKVDGKVVGHCDGDKKILMYQRDAAKAGPAPK